MQRLPALVLAISVITYGANAQEPSDTSRERPKLRVLPVIGSAPETGLQYGATALRIWRRGPASTTRPSQLQVYGIYTTESQARLFVQLDHWSEGNKTRLRGRVEYQRFPLSYFGIGALAPEADEEKYTAVGPIVQVLGQRLVAPSVYVGGGVRIQHTRIHDVAAGGTLARGQVFGASGGTVVAVQGLAARDTRDNILSAHRGGLVQLTTSIAEDAFGSDYSYVRYAFDARRYWARRNHVLAAQVLAEVTAGSSPFDQLVQFGSDTAMRGYTRGRYRDREGASFQVEYRTPFVRRVGAVAFAGGGLLAPTVGDIFEGPLLPTYGVGLRVLLLPADRAAIRVDYGRGKKSSGLYVSLGEAF